MPQPVKLDPPDLRLLDQRIEFALGDVVRLQGIPYAVIALWRTRNRAHALAADLTMVNDGLMLEYDDRLILDFNLPTVGDPEAKLLSWK